MIQRDLVLTINDDKASLNEPLVIYQHDRGITLRIKVLKYKFAFNKIMEEDFVADTSIISARAIILRPEINSKNNNDDRMIECPRQPIEDDCVIITIPIEWTDVEVGKYRIQLQLYGSDYINERVTLPPFEFTVAKPIGFQPEEGVAYPPSADGGVADGSEAEDGEIDDDGRLPYGEYEETEWEPGDLITAAHLNKMEDAIEYLVRTQKAKAIYTPHVNIFGDLTWTNDLELDNPEPVNIMGPRGPQGEAGKSFTYDDMTDEDKADITRDFITCSQNITRIEIVTQYPAYEESNVLYIRVSDII